MIRPLLWLPLLAVSASATLAQEASLEKQVRKLHAQAGGAYCAPGEGGYVPEDDYLSWTFSYQPSWSSDESDREEVTLIRIFCGSGAYNVQHAYYWLREYEGLQPLALAEPTFEIAYENDDIDAGVKSVTVTGIGGTTILVNSEFDPNAKVITSHSLWRGIGDASSSGVWFFDDGRFTLVEYDIDASYDGEVNPETVVTYLAAQGG